ncbi:hypothetical protein GUJ93_ZPchr0011g27355 [Zizania palustris]|uniref:D-arabinono-1,4-lactone oxidase C-terminal domain-containing protein n=1 Tax=Zizania palustris TaxID=103762 RepID=A0A8J5WMI7_ZIZPA|nr:hypothetical protein GUJ93_ZPchr0011g27355 [Zizania palustris]
MAFFRDLLEAEVRRSSPSCSPALLTQLLVKSDDLIKSTAPWASDVFDDNGDCYYRTSTKNVLHDDEDEADASATATSAAAYWEAHRAELTRVSELVAAEWDSSLVVPDMIAKARSDFGKPFFMEISQLDCWAIWLHRMPIQSIRVLIRTEAESNDPEIDQLSFTELRDRLLALDPLDKDHVIRINKAEAEYWKKSEGYRIGWSDEILGFDCGGQQWVSETCFPAGTLAKPNMKDLDYIEELLQLIEKEDIPAPAPIEQRWTACSTSPMSPASSSQEDDIFSWVGIIMYLPTSDARQRKEITEDFFNYRSVTQASLWDGYSAYEHWAKIEVPKDKDELAELQARLRKRFPVDAYNKARRELDPNKVLSNAKLEKLFPVTESIQHAK